MASKTSTLLVPEYDSLVQGVVDNLECFIENINCIRETFEYSEINLRAQHAKTIGLLNSFLDACEKSDYDGQVVLMVPEGKIWEYLNLNKRRARAKRAFELIPPSYFVSLVSAYDTFFAGLIRCYYSICPEKLLESDMSFQYRDLQQFADLSEIKKRIVEKNVETLLRDSHIAQFDWFAKALGVSTLKSYKGWSEFVELTERRNLFVHSNGTVSNQYVSICKKNSALPSGVIEGNQLSVSKEYFESAFRVLYKTAIMVTQMLLRIKYLEKAGKEKSKDLDSIFIHNVFNLIVDEIYDVAIDVSEMVLENERFTHNAYEKAYMILNYAQACKWNGNDEKCKEIINKEDWSAYTNELLIPRYALEENYPEVYKRMRQLGRENEHLTISAYREWPIFKRLREEKEFEIVFNEVFGEELDRITEMYVDSVPPTEITDASTATINGITKE